MSTQGKRKRNSTLSDDDDNYTYKYRRHSPEKEDSEALEDSDENEEENNDDAEEEEDNQNDDQVDDRNDHDSQKLQKMLDDEKGTKKWLADYISWHVKKARDKKLNEPENLDNYLYCLIRICQSRAWTPKFREDLEKYPNYKAKDEQNLQKRGGRCSRTSNTSPECGNCQACIRPWSVKVTLDGEPYDKETYRRSRKKGSPDVNPVVYYIGSRCHERSELYHDIFHFDYALHHKCIKKMKDVDGNKIEKVTKGLFVEMYKDWKRLMTQTKKYTGK
ncbi:uncharacterized protein LOC132732181 isoform X2 [Ruditapes philippinarum]|uniref:uncharacterized protein LOC132732181 isoform X2 n=1 Tax=Ruditapes philippinarum TaxID=129788 RepID=UPI00295BB1B9|nr:uncharacterized protein LOC132732181 isoform X2 [Ruditapes philippinarum]